MFCFMLTNRLIVYGEYVLLRSRKAKFELIKKQLILVRLLLCIYYFEHQYAMNNHLTCFAERWIVRNIQRG